MKTLQELRDDISWNRFKTSYQYLGYEGSKVAVMEDLLKEVEQQLSALQQENETLKATFEEFKRGVAKGSELHAHLKFDDQEFTPYQLALQENEKLRAVNAAAESLCSVIHKQSMVTWATPEYIGLENALAICTSNQR